MSTAVNGRDRRETIVDVVGIWVGSLAEGWEGERENPDRHICCVENAAYAGQVRDGF